MSGSAFEKSSRLAKVELSEIVRIAEAARAAKAAGADVIALGTGEPDFDTPDHVKDAAARAAAEGKTKYTPTAGTAELRAAVAEKCKRENGFDAAAENVCVTMGAKQALFNSYMVSLEPGEQVIFAAPFWTSYPDQVRLANGEPIMPLCGVDSGFKITPEALEAAITPKTRWVLLNSPSNPAGAVYSRAELEALAEVLRAHPRIWVSSDEIYEHLVFDGGEHVSFRVAAPDLADRTLTVLGPSKSYAMTGWRIGYAVGPLPLIKAMTAVQGQSTSGACSISQAAALASLTGPQQLLAERRAVFARRRDLVAERLNAAKGIACPRPEGAFYALPSCEGVYGATAKNGKRIENDADFCYALIDEVGVATVPGRAFGAPGRFRISTAYSDAELEEACRRIAAATDAWLG
ncbi:MAG: pyridoxal phosphate-dependent aminotransferase [Neomegalonema sp.]|nr:pyridoxal phosphate-dependent aminotransferase [Neomegalonema sp.]